MRVGSTIINAMTIDLEDWFHIFGVPGLEDTSKWKNFPSIVEEQTERILELFNKYHVRATFFVVGWIARKYPQLIARIAKQGHEIACHSYWHRLVSDMSRDIFRQDLRKAVAAISDATGSSPYGFRAPSFSITPGFEWAFDELLAQGFSYDASLFPIGRRHGGYPCLRPPHVVDTVGGGRIAELPMSVMRFAGAEFAFSGGGYFRLLPETLILRGVAQLNASGLPAVIYMHPRDFTKEWPWRELPINLRWQGLVGVAGTTDKLEALFRRYRFDTCTTVLTKRKLLTLNS